MRRSLHYYGTNRTLCDVLNEMRKCYECHNYAPLLSLVEEAQIMGNRMESGLSDKRDLLNLAEERSSLRKEVKELEAEVANLQKLTGKKNATNTDT